MSSKQSIETELYQSNLSAMLLLDARKFKLVLLILLQIFLLTY